MTAPPEKLADRPATPADESEAADTADAADTAPGREGESRSDELVSELLRRVRLSGERIVAHAPPRTFSIGFAGTGSLHFIEEGRLTLQIDAGPQVEHVGRGDVILLPRGDAHHLGDAGGHAAGEQAQA